MVNSARWLTKRLGRVRSNLLSPRLTSRTVPKEASDEHSKSSAYLRAGIHPGIQPMVLYLDNLHLPYRLNRNAKETSIDKTLFLSVL